MKRRLGEFLRRISLRGGCGARSRMCLSEISVCSCCRKLPGRRVLGWGVNVLKLKPLVGRHILLGSDKSYKVEINCESLYLSPVGVG